jgi:hypothetical protein
MKRPYESTEDFKLRLRAMLTHNKGKSILGAPKPHRCVVRPTTTTSNAQTQTQMQ